MRRTLIAVEAALMFAAVAWSLAIPDRVPCASLGTRRGIPCPRDRIEFEDHGPFVAVGVDQLLLLRAAIAAAGLAVGLGILVGTSSWDSGRRAQPGRSDTTEPSRCRGLGHDGRMEDGR